MLSFEIFLPEETVPEVIEWFEFMKHQSILSKEIIKLVSQNITVQVTAVSEAAVDGFTAANSIDDPLTNLFNWKDSSSSLFVEEKKQKKKILMV